MSLPSQTGVGNNSLKLSDRGQNGREWVVNVVERLNIFISTVNKRDEQTNKRRKSRGSDKETKT